MARLVKRFYTGLLVLICAVLCLPVPLATALTVEMTDTTIATTEPLGGDIATGDSREQSTDELPVVDDGTIEVEDQADLTTGSVEISAGQDTKSLKSLDDDQPPVDIVDDQTEEPDIPPDPIQYAGLVITRVQLQGAAGDGSSDQELVEVHNNSQADIDITGWGLYYTPKNSDNRTIIAKFELSQDNEIGTRLIIKPGAYMVFVSNEFAATNPDFESSGIFKPPLANTGGRLLIVDQEGAFVSGLAWGSWGDAVDLPEGPAVEVHQAGYLLARKMADYSRHQDTRQNQADFTGDVLIGGLYHVDPIVEVFDACLNIDGISEIVPDGMYRDEITGDCSSTPPRPPNNCQGLVLSEIGANLEEQFIELYNSTAKPLVVDGCRLSTDHSASKDVVFDKLTLAPGSYHVINLVDTELRIYKTTSSKVYILSEDQLAEVDQTEYSDLKPDTSWALIDQTWRQTYTVTPGAANQYLAYPPCDEGYVRNFDSGRCNKLAVPADLAECNANQYRNPTTGRCKLLTTVSSSLTPCGPGQFRNPDTNRCKSLTSSTSSLQPCDADEFRNPSTNRCKKLASTTSTLKPCQSGYERNPETNRCRKSQSTSAVAGASFPTEIVEATGSTFVGWWALGGVLLFGLMYAGWEWRHEMIGLIRRPKA